MSEREDRALQNEARALLQPARTPPAAPAEVRARALRRLELALPIAGGAATPATSLLARLIGRRVPAWSLLVSFAAGGAIAAAAIHRSPASSAPRPAIVELAPPAVSATAAPSAIATPIETSSPKPVAPALPSARAVSPSAAAKPQSESSLEAERAVLDVARTALGRGDGASVLAAAEEHARRFPRGALGEEREAMRIQALRLLHRDDEAEASLSRFRARFPTSLIRPALEAADAGAP